MLYDFLNDINKNNIKVNGVLHVGAHDGGELDTYLKNNISNIIFVEANPVIYKRLQERCSAISNVNISSFNIGISDRKGANIPFYVTNNDSASSSVLALKEHKSEYPDIDVIETLSIETTTIDDLITENNFQPDTYNVLNMDIQGAELLALTGAKAYLEKCDAVYLEVNFREMYENCGLLFDVQNFLSNFGFKRHKLVDTGRGWGDALYLKNKD
jgi:FkbM family methyltransferase